MNGARAACAPAAPFRRTHQPGILAQGIEERRARLDRERHAVAVDFKDDVEWLCGVRRLCACVGGRLCIARPGADGSSADGPTDKAAPCHVIK
jgi:hypothetical protein